MADQNQQPATQPTISGNPLSSELNEAQSVKSPYGKRNWLKWFLIYAIIALVVYGAIYFLFLSKQGSNPYSTSNQAPNSISQPTQVQVASPSTIRYGETANWKTYTDPKGIFSTQYPADWYENKKSTAVHISGPRKPLPLGVIGPLLSDVEDFPTLSRKAIVFQLENKRAEISLDKYSYDSDVCKGDTFGYCDSHTPKPIERKKIAIESKEAIWQISQASPSGPGLEVFIPKSETEIIVIFTNALNKDATDIDADYKNLVSQILSTFKFIDQEQTVMAQCNFQLYRGVGCETGYKCFQGFDTVCGPGDNCSGPRQVGDSMCHKLCSVNSDCSTGFKCFRKVAYQGDAIVLDDKICVKE